MFEENRMAADKIYSVKATDKIDALDVKELGESDAIAKGYTNLQPFTMSGKTHVIGYKNDTIDFWEFTAAAPFLKPIAQKLNVGAGYQIVIGFTIGNQPAVCCYTADKGVMNFYAVGDDFAISKPYVYFRNHEPSISHGFTTLKTFTTYGVVTYLGYNKDNGYVAMYTFGLTATTPARTPAAAPYLMTPMWAHA